METTSEENISVKRNYEFDSPETRQESKKNKKEYIKKIVKSRIDQFFQNSEIYNNFNECYTYDDIKAELFGILNDINFLKEEIIPKAEIKVKKQERMLSMTAKPVKEIVTTTVNLHPRTPMSKTGVRFERSPVKDGNVNINLVSTKDNSRMSKATKSTDAAVRNLNRKEKEEKLIKKTLPSRSPTNLTKKVAEEKDTAVIPKNSKIEKKGSIVGNGTNTTGNWNLTAHKAARDSSPQTAKKAPRAKDSVNTVSASKSDKKNPQVKGKTPSKPLKSIEININTDSKVDTNGADKPQEKSEEIHSEEKEKTVENTTTNNNAEEEVISGESNLKNENKENTEIKENDESIENSAQVNNNDIPKTTENNTDPSAVNSA